MVIETDAGLVPGRRLSESLYEVQLNSPTIVDLQRKYHTAYVELGDPGVPHGVVELPGLSFDQREQLRPYGVLLRHAPHFPKGANINFYTWLDEKTVRVLTYERGVEDYTLACGTGCGSVASVLWTKGMLPGGVLTAQVPGGTLRLTVEGADENISALYLEGPAEVLQAYEL